MLSSFSEPTWPTRDLYLMINRGTSFHMHPCFQSQGRNLDTLDAFSFIQHGRRRTFSGDLYLRYWWLCWFGCFMSLNLSFAAGLRSKICNALLSKSPKSMTEQRGWRQRFSPAWQVMDSSPASGWVLMKKKTLWWTCNAMTNILTQRRRTATMI